MNLVTASFRAALLTAGLLAASSVAVAGEKGLMHCFAFTQIDAASQAEWDAFKAATDKLPKTMKGVVTKVWHGKLRAPLNQLRTDGATNKKLQAGEKDVMGPVNRVQRQYGVCMLIKDEAALKTYAEHPEHKNWVSVYEKVRVAGTTTYDILAQ